MVEEKPWRQKGTGRARQGSIRAPQWIKRWYSIRDQDHVHMYIKLTKRKKTCYKDQY